MEVTFHRLFPRDLRTALDYYDDVGGSALGDRFFAEVEQCVERIVARPTGHHPSDGGYRRAQLRSFPYHMLYEVDDLGIWVAILRHDRRHWSYGLRRQKRG